VSSIQSRQSSTVVRSQPLCRMGPANSSVLGGRPLLRPSIDLPWHLPSAMHWYLPFNSGEDNMVPGSKDVDEAVIYADMWFTVASFPGQLSLAVPLCQRMPRDILAPREMLQRKLVRSQVLHKLIPLNACGSGKTYPFSPLSDFLHSHVTWKQSTDSSGSMTAIKHQSVCKRRLWPQCAEVTH